MNKQTIITILLAVFTFTCCMAKKKPVVNTTLRGYPSGAIDEYHFHAGKAVVKGRFTNRTKHGFSTFNVTGTDQFSNQEFVRMINVESDGSFLELISLPHSGWVYFDGADIPPADCPLLSKKYASPRQVYKAIIPALSIDKASS